jgi:dipeptidyl-peptidase-3
VLSHGKTVAGKLLVELQVRKSTADGAGAREFYTQLTTPLPGWEGEIRDFVLKKKLVCPVLALIVSVDGGLTR